MRPRQGWRSAPLIVTPRDIRKANGAFNSVLRRDPNPDGRVSQVPFFAELTDWRGLDIAHARDVVDHMVGIGALAMVPDTYSYVRPEGHVPELGPYERVRAQVFRALGYLGT